MNRGGDAQANHRFPTVLFTNIANSLCARARSRLFFALPRSPCAVKPRSSGPPLPGLFFFSRSRAPSRCARSPGTRHGMRRAHARILLGRRAAEPARSETAGSSGPPPGPPRENSIALAAAPRPQSGPDCDFVHVWSFHGWTSKASTTIVPPPTASTVSVCGPLVNPSALKTVRWKPSVGSNLFMLTSFTKAPSI
jgi:hypothetical protein